MTDDLLHLAELIAEQAAHMDAAQHRLLTNIRQFEEREGWASARSCADWLSWRVGWTLGTAREHVRVAKALGKLPLIDDALRLGKVSYCKVRAMTRVATPENERVLLMDAELTTGSQLEKICRSYRHLQRLEKDDARAADEGERILRRRDLDNGLVSIEVRLYPDEAEIVWAAIERATKELVGDTQAASRRERGERVHVESPAGEMVSASAHSTTAAVDSPIAFVDSTTAPADSTTAPVDSTTAVSATCAIEEHRSSPDTSRSAVADKIPSFNLADGMVGMARRFLVGDSSRTPVEVVVTVAATALQDGVVPATERFASIGNGGWLTSEAARRLACDAGIVNIVEDQDGSPLSVGRRTRSIPTSIRRALIKRDRCCQFPGCSNRVYLEGHHLLHWADGGETKLSNLILLCSRHHRYVHEHGFRIELDAGGQFDFFDAKGRVVKAVPPRIQRHDLGWPHIVDENRDLAIVPHSCRWDGTPVQYADVCRVLYRVDEGSLSPDDIC